MARKDTLISGYAEAIYSVAEAEGALADVEDELFRFANIAEADAKLRDALRDAAVPVENRKAMVSDLLGGRVNPQTINLVGFILEQGRARQLGEVVEALVELAAERRSNVIAEVRSAVALNAKQKGRLQAALSKATGRKVELKVLVDPSVVGGVIARVGDQVFDGTVRTRLKEAKEQLGSV